MHYYAHYSVPLTLEKNNITVSVSLQEMSANISIPVSSEMISRPIDSCMPAISQNLSPCVGFSVESYILMFSEVANDRNEELSHSFSISHEPNGNPISVIARNLLLGRQYEVTLFAFNSAGSSSISISVCKRLLLYLSS